MQKLIITLVSLLLMPSFIFAQEVPAGNVAKQPVSFEKMRKTGTTLIITGGISMAGGVIFLVSGATQNATSLIGSVVTLEPDNYDADAGSGAAVAGGFLFFGGIAMLVTGIVKTSKAKKMKAAAQVSFLPYAPPGRVAPKVNIPQTGFTIGIPIGK